jgi:hypothetical protein
VRSARWIGLAALMSAVVMVDGADYDTSFFAKQGYAVVTPTARGFGNSCADALSRTAVRRRLAVPEGPPNRHRAARA